jgi:hypothetical protein
MKLPYVSLALLLAVFCSGRFAQGGGVSMPSFDQVRKLVEKQLDTQADYQSGDIISQQQVTPIFDQLQTLGWSVRAQPTFCSWPAWRIKARVARPKVAFMRQSSRYPRCMIASTG